MMTEHWDHIIIGGGVIGLCTAYNLVKAGAKPLIIEQFNLPHTRGSSHGQSRLIREAHIEDHYSVLTSQSHKQWEAIEKEGGKQLLVNTGLLLLQDNYGKGLQSSREAMERRDQPHEWIDGKELQQRYPMIRYSESYSGILDKTASIILADKALNVLQRLVEEGGAHVRDGERVLAVKPGPVVTIETSKGTYTANKLVLATGPWSKELTDSLGLQLPLTCIEGLHLFWRAPSVNSFQSHQIPMFYEDLVFKEPRPYTRGFFGLFPSCEYPGLIKCIEGLHLFWRAPNVNSFQSHQIPIVMEDFVSKQPRPYTRGFFWLFPTCEYPGLLKIVTRGEPPPFYCHPDERDKYNMQPMIDLVAGYIKQHFPGVATKPSIMEPCMYCLTPDKNGIIDRHPNFPNILIGTAFSGKGFMLAPIVGQVLSELAMDCQPSVDTTAFAIGRFVQQSKM